jgi:hypothetical protein
MWQGRPSSSFLTLHDWPPCSSSRPPFVFVIADEIVALLALLRATNPTATTSGNSSGRNTAEIGAEDEDEASLRFIFPSLFMVVADGV